jgi:hypothetical protein
MDNASYTIGVAISCPKETWVLDLAPYSPKLVEGAFSEVHLLDVRPRPNSLVTNTSCSGAPFLLEEYGANVTWQVDAT